MGAGGIDLTAIILAGGESRRFGAEKPLMDLRGKAMVEWVLEKIGVIASEAIIVTTRKNLKGMPNLHGARVLEDELPALGPLGGIYTGLKHARRRICLVAPSDTPFISRDLMGFLVRSLGEHQAVVPMWPNGYLESLHSVLERDSALKAAGEAIDSGDLSVRGLFDRLSDVEFMDVELLREYDPELLTFFNVNTWEDLKKARRIAGDERDYQDG